jgi:hypothetical protein
MTGARNRRQRSPRQVCHEIPRHGDGERVSLSVNDERGAGEGTDVPETNHTPNFANVPRSRIRSD